MACNNTNYYVGQGTVYMRALGDGCGAATEAFYALGDADSFTISPTTTFIEHYESTSGLRKKALRVQDTQDTDFSLSVKNISAKNLAVFLAGTDAGSTVGGSVVDESIAVVAAGTVFTRYQGISAVTVTSNSGAVTLTLTDDYTVDSRTGAITLTSAGYAKVVGGTIEVDYTHVGEQFDISALQNLSGDYEIRFEAINRSEPNTPMTVILHRASISTADELSLIGSDVMSLNITGAALEDANGDTLTIRKANSVA